MARVLLALVCVALAARYAWGQGTIIELHKDGYFGGPPLWVVPNPTVGSQEAPLGCTNLPPKFQFQSGRIYWNETGGTAQCHFLWFFYGANCDGGARGVEVGEKPSDPTQPWVTQDPIYQRTTYSNIMLGKSVGCSFETDPCVQFPCSDANAQCNSSLGWSWEGKGGKQWESQTRNCSICKPGFIKSKDGTCLTPADACASLKCPSPAKCESDPVKGPVCKCPGDTELDPASGTCKAQAVANDAAWIPALNTVRKQAMPTTNGVSKASVQEPTPLTWDANLAAAAKNWTLQLNATQCGKEPVVLTKIPGGNYSESDVWVSWSTDEASAVQLWAPSPSDSTNPRTARITDGTTKLAGCGKTSCGSGAFFTCLFYPKTF